MSTKHPGIFEALCGPFQDHEVKVRTQSGRQIRYITARTAMNRLDYVLGPENWWDNFDAGENSVVCRLTIRLPDGQLLTKVDAGGYAGMADSGDDDKSGYSDAFKRAAVKFGVARYLYGDGVPTFLRAGAGEVPDEAPATPNVPERVAGKGDAYEAPSVDGPRTGKALFAWAKEMEQRHEVGILRYLTGWAKLQEFPSRMVAWDADQVSLAYTEAVRKLRAHAPADGDAYEEALAN